MAPIFSVKAQDDFNFNNEDFFRYKERKQNYYDSLASARNGNLKGTGYTPFKRWVQYWEPLVINEGGFVNALKAKRESIERQKRDFNNLKSSKYGKTSSTVKELGPINVPITNPSESAYWNRRILGAGRIHFLEFDDINNRVLCGSPAGAHTTKWYIGWHR